MERLSIGIVGAGEITRKLHLPVLLSMPNVEVAWLCDHRKSQAVLVGDAYGVKPIAADSPASLPSCDVALLAIPVEAREAYLSMFAGRRTAVLCEKPFAASRADHERLIDTFPEHGLGAGYQRRFYNSSLLLQEVLRQRWFGPLRRIGLAEGDRSRGSGVDHSFLDDGRAVATRGALFDLGAHGIDLVLHLIGAAQFAVRSCEVVFDGTVDRKVTAQIDLTSASGGEPVRFDYCVSWLDRQTNLIRLDFEHATVWSALSPGAEVFLGDPSRPAGCVRLTSTLGGATTPNQAFYLEWREFLSGVRTQAASTLAARSSLLATALMEEMLARGRASHA